MIDDYTCDPARERFFRDHGLSACVKSNGQLVQLTMSKETYDWWLSRRVLSSQSYDRPNESIIDQLHFRILDE